MQGQSLARQCVRFLVTLEKLQTEAGGNPVKLSVEGWSIATGIPQERQVKVRQTLIGSGLLRLSVGAGQWTYAIGEAE